MPRDPNNNHSDINSGRYHQLTKESSTGSAKPPPAIGDKAEWIVDEFRKRGCPVNPTCRLASYAKEFAKNGYAGPFGPDDQKHLLESLIALRDVVEIAQVLEQFPDLNGYALKVLQKDSPEPPQFAHARGRDKQHEYAIAATCRAGGMIPILEKEPDLWCKTGGVLVALAAKRIKSENQLLDEIEYAAKQVQRCDLRFGVAVVDTSLGWNPEHITLYSSKNASDMGASLMERMHRKIAAIEFTLSRVIESHPKLLAVLLLDLTFSHHFQLGWSMNRCSTFVPATRGDTHRARVLRSFTEGWQRGCPNLERIGEPQVIRAAQFGPVDTLIPLRTVR